VANITWPKAIKIARLAQWILESNRGKSDLAVKHLNFGGFKWRPELSPYGESVLIKVPSETQAVTFTKFNSVKDFVLGSEAFMKRAPYVKTKWELSSTPEDYIERIGPVYATDPKYIVKVKSVVKEAEDIINKYEAVNATEPEVNLVSMKPPQVRPSNRYKITKPIIIPVKGAKYKSPGKFSTTSGNCKGAVVHYTVSGRSQTSAIGVVRYMAFKGYGCLVMDENGNLYGPDNYNYRRDVVYHSGASSYKGFSGMSTYCVGLEICNWGTDGKKMGAKDLRTVTRKDNMFAGTYQKYTDAQEKSIINFLLWEKSENPEFDFNWVVGHDTIATPLGRKTDPGGSLSTTIPDLVRLLNDLYPMIEKVI
jgi:hypothetical protein